MRGGRRISTVHPRRTSRNRNTQYAYCDGYLGIMNAIHTEMSKHEDAVTRRDTYILSRVNPELPIDEYIDSVISLDRVVPWSPEREVIVVDDDDDTYNTSTSLTPEDYNHESITIAKPRKKRKTRKRKAQKEAVSTQSENPLAKNRCCICMSNWCDIVYIECGHLCICCECLPGALEHSDNCPICRKQSKTTRIFPS